MFVRIKPHKTANAAPFRLLTDNGSEFADRLCVALKIEHRLTQPRYPQTKGMVERFNGRISFESGQDLSTTLERYVLLYNQHLPQLALQHRTPIQAMKEWQKQRPDLFKKRVCNRPGLNS